MSESGTGSVLDRYRLDGRVAVVTGAASGIGAATARALADAGAIVVGGDVTAAPGVELVDVRDRAAVGALADLAADRHGRLDAFVNVAGIVSEGPLADVDEAEVDRVLAVNLKGVLFGCQAAVSTMRRLGTGGNIVNVASAAAFIAAPTRGTYAMAKAGVVSLTRTLAMELGRTGIRVNAVAPGFVISPMTLRNSTSEADEAELRAAQARRTPLGLVGEPDDIAAAILYLVADASNFVTGQVLHPNGGAYMA